jgi:O-Antigen ligase
MDKIGLSTRYLQWHTWILLGYALMGRGFSYLGVPPFYIGEITLLLGFIGLLCNRAVGGMLNVSAAQLLKLPPAIFLVIFMLWCSLQTFPYIPIYGINALRDSATWYYGFYAILIAIFLIMKPHNLLLLLERYAKFVPIFLLISPFLWQLFQANFFPPMPGAPSVRVVDLKAADALTHLVGCIAFFVAFQLSWISQFLCLLLLFAGLVLPIANRSSLLALGFSLILLFLLRPKSKRVWWIIAVVSGLIFVTLMTYPQVIESLTTKMATVFSDDAGSERYQGTKEFRIRWWNYIINYTFHGEYFWTGKGFGIGLGVADGFIDESVRSPHNGNMTVLARSGVPGFCLWILTQLTWAIMIVLSYVDAVLRKKRRWSALFMFLFVYWLPFMITIYFEAVLEGPTGGIWFWTLFGVGLASIHLYREDRGDDLPPLRSLNSSATSQTSGGLSDELQPDSSFSHGISSSR